MQIHGQVPRKNSGASGSTYTENVVAGSSSPPACGSSGIMVVSDSRISTYGLFKIKNQAMFKNQECQVGAPCRAETPSNFITFTCFQLTCMSVLN
jgi:hypothetical protein